MYTIIISIIAAIVGLLLWRFPNSLNSSLDQAQFAKIITILAFTGLLSRAVLYKNFTKIIKELFIWIGIMFFIVAIYTYRYDILNSKIASNFFPARATLTSNGQILLTAQSNDHFYVETSINGHIITCMVDTGASRLGLSLNDAYKAGIQVDKLNFNNVVQTANGATKVALTKVNSLQIADLTMQNVEAFVSQLPQDQCLLGMSFLSRLKKFEFEKDQLILTP